MNALPRKMRSKVDDASDLLYNVQALPPRPAEGFFEGSQHWVRAFFRALASSMGVWSAAYLSENNSPRTEFRPSIPQQTAMQEQEYEKGKVRLKRIGEELLSLGDEVKKWKKQLLPNGQPLVGEAQHPPKMPTKDYVQFYAIEGAQGGEDHRGALKSIARFRPTPTFSARDAVRAGYMTITGGLLRIRREEADHLRHSGGKVRRTASTNPEDTEPKPDKIAVTGDDFHGYQSMSTTYKVVLPLFEGPLDLLLHLIEERELDITKVSLAMVTDQYVAHISRLEKLEADKLADFLTIAAQLLLIKSRVLLPQPSPEEEQEQDISDQLVRQLIEYRRFKTAAQELRTREEEGLRAYTRLLPLPELERSFRLEGVTLDDLVETLRQAMLTQQATPSVDEVVTPLHVSLPDKVAQLERLLLEHRRFSFHSILATTASRMEMIVTFLALLQLVKRRKVAVEQGELFGEIIVSLASQLRQP